MSTTVPAWVRIVADVVYYAAALVLLSVVVGITVSAMALSQPVPFEALDGQERFDTWETADPQRDLDVSNAVAVERAP